MRLLVLPFASLMALSSGYVMKSWTQEIWTQGGECPKPYAIPCKDQTCCMYRVGGSVGYVCCPTPECLCIGEAIRSQNLKIPNGTLLTKESSARMKICEHSLTCPTCCWKSGEGTCCPFPNGVCCSEGKTCCPQGLRCDLHGGRCVVGYTVMKSLATVEAP